MILQILAKASRRCTLLAERKLIAVCFYYTSGFSATVRVECSAETVSPTFCDQLLTHTLGLDRLEHFNKPSPSDEGGHVLFGCCRVVILERKLDSYGDTCRSAS